MEKSQFICARFCAVSVLQGVHGVSNGNISLHQGDSNQQSDGDV